MNINQHFLNLAQAEGANASQLITQRERLFKDKVMPELIKRKANETAILDARSKWFKQTDQVMIGAGLLPKDGQSSQSFKKDQRAERAVNEATKTGSKLPIIKESVRTFGDNVGNMFSQGVGSTIEGLAGFVRDIGENETDSIAANTAKYGQKVRKGYENSASTFQKGLQAGESGKAAQLASGAIQSVPAMALPFGAAKGLSAVASKIPLIASKAPYVGLAGGLVAGHTQNYGEVRRNATANLQRDFPTWEKLQGNPTYEKNFQQIFDSGVGVNQARKQAHAKTLDDLSEGAADKYGTAMTAIDFIAPSGATLGSGILKNLPNSKIGKALVGGGVSADLVRREINQAPRMGIAKLIPDIGKTANIAAAKMVGKQALEEGLQGGIGEYGAQAATANIGGKAVDWKSVGKTILEEGAIGGIMGGGMQSASGGSATSQAKDIASNLRNQTNRLRQEEAAARQELASATEYNNPEQIQSAQANLQNIGAEANKVKQAYQQYGIDVPHFVDRFSNQYTPQEQQQQEEVIDPEAIPATEDQPQPAPAPAPAPVNQGMADTTNIVMDSVTKGILTPEEAQAIQSDPIHADVFSLATKGDEVAAYNVVMNAVSLGNLSADQAQTLIEAIPRYKKGQKSTVSSIVDNHVKQQVQPTPLDDGGEFSNAIDLDPNTLEPIDPSQPSLLQDDISQPQQFTDQTKAYDYLNSNGLQDSHEMSMLQDGTIDVRPRKNTIPDDPNLNDFGYNPKNNLQQISEDPNLTEFSEGAVSVGESIDENIPDIIQAHEEIIEPAQPIAPIKPDHSKAKHFSNSVKANLYLTENNLKDSHEIKKLEDGRVQVQLKAEAPEPVVKQKELTNAEQITGIFSTLGDSFADAATQAVADKLSKGDEVKYYKPASIQAAEKNPNYYVQKNNDGSANIIGVKTSDGQWVGQAPAQTQELTPKADLTFAEKFRDAHLNNPSIKPRLINDEIDNGRSRPDVLKEASEIVKSINDSKPKEPAAQPERTDGTTEVLGKGIVENLKKQGNEQKTSENGIQENDAPDSMKSGDIGRGSDGKPFLSKNAALRGLKLRDVKDTHEIIEIAPSSFVLREKAKAEPGPTVKQEDKPEPEQPTENPFQKYDELAKQYGRSVKPDGSITKANGQDTQVKILEKKGRLHIEDTTGKLIFSGAANPESLGKFLEDYWYDKKQAPNSEAKVEEQVQQLNSDLSDFSTEGFDFESLSTSQKNAHLKRAVKKAANSLKSNGFTSDTSGDGLLSIFKDGYFSAIIRYDMDQDNAEITFSGKQIRVAPLTFSDIQQYGLELQVKVRLDKIVEDHFFKTEANKKAKPETKVKEVAQETKTSKVNVHEYGLAIDSKGDVIDFDSKEAAEKFILDNELGGDFYPGKMGDKYEIHTDQYNAYERYKSNDPKINDKFDVKNLPNPDIGRASDNAPFSNESSANLALKKKGLEDSYAVVRLAPSQFVLRDKSQIQDTSTPIDLSDPVKLVESLIVDGRKVFDSGEPIQQGHEVTFTYKEKAAYGYTHLGIDLQLNDINEIVRKIDGRIVMSDPYFSGGSKNLSSNDSFKYKYGLRNSGVKKLVISPMKNGDIKITATVDSDSKKMTRLKLVEDKPETKTTPTPAAAPVIDPLEFPLDKVKENESNNVANNTSTTEDASPAPKADPREALNNDLDVYKISLGSNKVIYINDTTALVVGHSLIGQPVYLPVKQGRGRSSYDIDGYKNPSNWFTSEEMEQMRTEKQEAERKDQEKAKQYPNGVFTDAKSKVVISESIPEKLGKYLDTLMTSLGMDKKVFLFTPEDLKVEGAADKYKIYGGHRSTFSAGLDPNENGSTRVLGMGTKAKDAKDFYISINSDMTLNQQIEIIGHELGHIIEKTALKDADPETLQAIKSEFEAWLKDSKGKTANEHVASMRNRESAEDTIAKNKYPDLTAEELGRYWHSYSEWFADQVSRWATTSEKPVSIVEKFFSSIAGKLKELAKIITGKGAYQPAASVKKLLDGMDQPYLEPNDHKIEFPLDKVKEAYGHAHLSPGNTARAFKESFDNFIQSEIDEAKPLATTPDQQTALDEAIHWVKDSYINKALPPLLSAASVTVSSARAGRNNFDSKQADKRGSALDKATAQFDAELGRLKGYAKLKVLAARTPEQKQVDADAETKIQEEKATAEQAKAEAKLKAEEEAKANKKRASNEWITHPDTAKHMTMEEWKAIGKDYKGITDGVRRHMGVPVWITDEGKPKLKSDSDSALTVGDTITFSEAFDYALPNELYTIVTSTKAKLTLQTETGSQFSFKPNILAIEKAKNPELYKIDSAKAEPQQVDQPTEAPEASSYETAQKQFDSVVQRLNEGEEGITIDEVQQAYKALMDNHDSVVAEFSKMTKQQLLDTMHPYYASMYKSYKKDELVDKLVSNAFRKMDFSDGGVIQISYGDKRTMPEIVRDKIQAATQENLNKFLASQREEIAQAAKDEEAAKAGMNDPKTMDDFKRIYANGDFDNFKAFYRSLTLPQQTLYDELKSSEFNEKRMQEIERNKAYREASKPSHAVESTTEATLFAGKHTKNGSDIWTVALNGRVDGDAFNEYRSQAKSLGGYYSRYTGGGAVAGFIFDNEAQANEFLNLVTGDYEANSTDPEPEAIAVDPQAEVEVIETDAQRKAEKLREKAQTIIDRGEQNINRDRKTNTAKRAGEAARAEEQANKSIFLGETLNRIADGIENGSVKYLSRLGAMTQLAHLESLLQRASHDQQRETNAKEREINATTISYVEFPQYKTWIDSFNNIRSDLKSANPRLAEKLEKTIGIRYHNAYARWLNETNEYGTENYVGQLARKADGTPAVFKTNIKQAETLVKAVNKQAGKDSFEVFKIKNGEYAVISSYTTAMENESWKPTNSDKQMTLTNEFGNELYNALKQHKRKNPSYHMNWLIESMYDSVSRMEKLGIHDPATFRAAMREYLNLRSKEKANDPIKEMERSMIGRSNDGLDFFPTPRNVVEQMIELADMDSEMKVLEPSAGMGHIADVLQDHGIRPDVIELSGKRQELLKLKGYSVVGNDFLMFDPKNRAPNYGDVFKTADGQYQGVMRGSGSLGSSRVRLMNEETGQMITYFDREDLELVQMNGIHYDRIIMNPPFSDRRDAEHIYHAFDLLADDGVLVAIAGEGVFFGKDKAAQGFQEWLDKVGAEVTPLDAGTFNDPSLPVTTGVKARIIKINKADSKGKQFSRSEDLTQAPEYAKDAPKGSTPAQVRTELVNRFGEDVISQLEQQGVLTIVPTHTEQGVEGFAENGKVTLVADAITAENIVPVFLHELGGHIGMQGVMKPAAYQVLMKEFNRLVKSGNTEALEAKRLAERETNAEVQADEYLPYLITVAAQNQAKQGPVQRLISRVLGAVKAWAVDKLGLNLKLNPSDILALAKRMVKTVAKNPPPTPPKGKLKTDQTETEAFKKWFGNSKIVDESGKPKVVYHGTNQSFNIFNVSDVGIHAGTMDQAQSRKEEKSAGQFNVMPLYMRINNPLRLKDSPSWKDPAFYIQKTGIAQHLSAPLVKRITGFYDELKGIDLKSVQGQEQALELAMRINRLVTKELKAQGYDGIVYKNTHDGTSLENKMREDDAWIVFDPEQIKSAINNNGDFDSSNPDIRYSRTDNPENDSRSRQREFLDSAAKSAFGQMSLRGAEGAKTLSKRTLNLFQTMLHKSLTDKSGEFKKTFDLVQGKINHVTFASSKSMDVAPNVLTQLEAGSDYWKEAKRVGRTLGHSLPFSKIEKAKIDMDLEKVGKLMFENTLLEDSERHTEKELRKLGFDEDQIKIYNEIREAIDTSLDTFANTTFSNIYKHLGGTDKEILDLAAKDLDIHDHYNAILKLIDNLTKDVPEKTDARQAAIEAIDKVLKKANDLKDNGYVPLMRFGKYFVRIFNPATGEVAYRQHFESESERNIFFNNYDKESLPAGYEIEQSQINELEHKLFQGVSPETVALFAKESGLPIGDAETAYIKYAVKNNHALKRLLRRQGIDGFDSDVKRVLAAFVLSNARYSANQIYNPAIDESITDIKDPAYQEDAIRLRDYALDTQEELAPIKNFAFVYYMGFSAMFGLVNLTQPILQTLPYLMQYTTDHATIPKAFLKAIKTWRKGTDTMDQVYKADYERARKEGHLDPQNTWMMQGLERGKSGLGASTWQLISHSSGLFAQASETVNRRTTLFAALDVAKSLGQEKLEKLGFKDSYDFAVRAIQETQGIYNKGNRPRVARGNIGSVLMMYKQFMISYIEQMSRMQKSGLYGGEDDQFKKKMAKLVGFGISRSVLVALGVLMSFSGATGLPFMRDILDAIETTGGLIGKPINTEREVQIALHDALGQTLGSAVNTALMDGFVNLNPVMDVKGRMGMGDLIPATAYFSPTTSEYMKSSELSNIAGPMGGLLEKLKESVALAQVGAYGQAGVQLLPKAATSLGQGVIAATTGDYRNMKTGVKTNDATVLDGIIKTLDAQPATIAKEGRVRGLEMKDKAAQAYNNKRWKEGYEKALESGDRMSIRDIQQKIVEYNKDDPRYPVNFNQKTAETNFKKSNQNWQEKRKNKKGLEWMDEYNEFI